MIAKISESISKPNLTKKNTRRIFSCDTNKEGSDFAIHLDFSILDAKFYLTVEVKMIAKNICVYLKSNTRFDKEKHKKNTFV